MRVLQLNLNHCETAHDILEQTVRELVTDVTILSEPYRIKDSIAYVSDKTKGASIWACGRWPITAHNSGRETGFVWANIRGIHIYSCYAPPRWDREEFITFLTSLVMDARGKDQLIIAGDFNAWAVEWGSTGTNVRGQLLLEALTVLDLSIANVGATQTFRRAGAGSTIDVTFESSALVNAWEVSENYTGSDHQAILYELKTQSSPRLGRALPSVGWKTSSFDADIFKECLNEVPPGDAQTMAYRTMESIKNACDASMSKRRDRGGHRPPVYWWTDDIARLRASCNKARRSYQRARGRPTFQRLQDTYKNAKRELTSAIKTSKRRCGEELCLEVEQDPWGRPYKIVTSKLKGERSQPPTCPVLLQNIVSTLFPEQHEQLHQRDTPVAGEVIPEVSIDELLRACNRVGNNKASGPDGIPNIALKTAIKERPEMFTELYTQCLKEGIFPDMWKVQRLVLLLKGGDKPPEQPSSYRPLCILDTSGKIFERIIGERLTTAIEECGGLSDHQYGFRKGRSTIDAVNLVINTAKQAIAGKRWKRGSKNYCAVVTLDVKNAFNSAQWRVIREALRRRTIPQYLRRIINNYLNERILEYWTDDGPKRYQVTGGVPQGSVLGPILWILMYDDLLKLKIPAGVRTVCFADDTAVVAVAKYLEEIEQLCNETISIIRKWLSSVGLELAGQKTEALLITSRKQKESITLTVGKHEIASKPSLKYLGITIDTRLTFKEHLYSMSKKAAKVVAAVSRLMPNSKGPRQSKRRLLATVASSVILYGAPVWAKAMETKTYGKSIRSVYRLSALRVVSAFRTVSTDAVCVVANMPPLDLVARERQQKYLKLEVGEEQGLVACWQTRWDLSQKGRWTYRLIPNIRTWITRGHGEVDYYLTQLLTGHGCYRARLFQFNYEDDPHCTNCWEHLEDVEHVFFHCPRFDMEREELRETIGDVVPETIVGYMLQSTENWKAVVRYATAVLKELRRIERLRRV